MNPRLNRIFHTDGRAVIIPIDHTMAMGLAEGWEEPGRTLAAVLEGRPDAIMTTYGIAKHFRWLLQDKVAVIVRLDSGMTPFSEQWGANTRWEQLYSVEDALRIGACGVIAMTWFGLPVEMESMQMTARIAAECERWQVPFAAEALPPQARWYDTEALATAARTAAELGADFIKTHYPGSVEGLRRIHSVCPVPVLTAGGARLDAVRDLMQCVADMLQGGGAGVFCGRNVWQSHNPAAVTRALVRLVHEGATVDQALAGAPPLD